MRAIVTTVIAANVLNVVLDWALVFGELGAPTLGAVGAGLATTLARWFMVGMLLRWPGRISRRGCGSASSRSSGRRSSA